MNLELRHLKVVCAIAETGSVTKAASQLGLAQPALTAQLQRIERTLGGPLFERDRRGARPTALGELVLARARVLLPAMKGLQDEAARLAGTGDRDGPLPVRRREQPRSSAAWCTGWPRSSRRRTSRTYASWSVDELARMVGSGRLDYALNGVCGDAVPSPDLGLAWRVVSVDAIFVMLPEGHPLAERDEVDLAGARRRAVGGRARRRLLRRLLRGSVRAGRVHAEQDVRDRRARLPRPGRDR